MAPVQGDSANLKFNNYFVLSCPISKKSIIVSIYVPFPETSSLRLNYEMPLLKRCMGGAEGENHEQTPC